MAKRPAKQRAPRRTHHHGDRELHTHEAVVAFLLELEIKFMAVSQKVTDALAAQDAKISEIDQKVDAFIANHQTNSDADDQVVVDRLTAQGQALDSIGAKLTPPA